jgi:hypothetical protein
MSVEIKFPLEFVVEGVPVSLQAKRPRTMQAWKSRLRREAKRHLPVGHWATERPVHITILYFPDTQMEGDLDNILKPILDALSKLIYLDDAQVERILVQKFEPGRIATFSQPSAMLAEAVAKSGPRLYIKIDVPSIQEFADD